VPRFINRAKIFGMMRRPVRPSNRASAACYRDLDSSLLDATGDRAAAFASFNTAQQIVKNCWRKTPTTLMWVGTGKSLSRQEPSAIT
jgi:hypothetical protein